MFISVPDPKAEPFTASHPYMSAYTNGIAQPATVVLTREKEVWFTWTTIPNPRNGGGAAGRPYLGDVWAEIKSCKLDGSRIRSSKSAAVVDSRKMRKQTLSEGRWSGMPIKFWNRSMILIVVLAMLIKRFRSSVQIQSRM